MTGSHHEVAPEVPPSAAVAKPLLPAAVLLRRRWVPSWAAAVSPAGCATPSIATPAGRSNRHGTPYSQCSRTPGTRRARRRRVNFSSPVSLYEVTPYEECYGLHPSQFNFDASGCMAPLSPEGSPPVAEQHAGEEQVKIPASSPVEADDPEASPSTRRFAAASTSLRWADMVTFSPTAGAPHADSSSSSLLSSEPVPCPARGSPACQGLGVTRAGTPHTMMATSMLTFRQTPFGRTSPSWLGGSDPILGSDLADECSTMATSQITEVAM